MSKQWNDDEVHPLTHPAWPYLQARNWDCNCGAPEVAHHSETCSVTPIYAGMIRERGSWRDVFNDLILEWSTIVPRPYLHYIMNWPNPFVGQDVPQYPLDMERQ